MTNDRRRELTPLMKAFEREYANVLPPKDAAVRTCSTCHAKYTDWPGGRAAHAIVFGCWPPTSTDTTTTTTEEEHP